MRVYFILDELKTIRTALYTQKNSLEDHKEKKELKGSVLSIVEDEVEQLDKILLYVNACIQKEDA